MRAANILKGFDSSKHSGVIAFFNKEYIKNGTLERNLSMIIKSSSFLREKSEETAVFFLGWFLYAFFCDYRNLQGYLFIGGFLFF